MHTPIDDEEYAGSVAGVGPYIRGVLAIVASSQRLPAGVDSVSEVLGMGYRKALEVHCASRSSDDDEKPR